MRWKLAVFSIGAVVLVCASAVLADDRLVPSVYPTIQAGIDAAIAGDTVVIAPGSYTGPGNRDLDFGGKAITVRSIDPNDPNVVAATVIDCDGEPHRGFLFHSGEDSNSVIDGLVIINGYASSDSCSPPKWGGAVCCLSSSPTIRHCSLLGNYAKLGAGVFNLDGSPILIDCRLVGNQAYGKGGGMYNQDAAPSLIGCSFVGNSAEDYGGAMRNHNSDVIITNCLFTGNSALRDGGAICNYESDPNITNSTFSGNSADANGAGIYNSQAGDYDSRPRLINCILWGNSDCGGTDESAQVHAGEPVVEYCCIQGLSGGLGGTGNIDADPCFTDPCNNDYHLSASSPCINAADPNYVIGIGQTDIDGQPRVMGSRLDMGADEFAEDCNKSPDLAPDGNINNEDLKVLAQAWLSTPGREFWNILSDLNCDGVINIADFAILAMDWTDCLAPPEPGISYQIEDCNMEAGASSLAEYSESTRFTVTVEGQYINFEDMMVANCCPDELELEMTVEGNLITIYETEYTIAGGCRCMCDFPVTATLGPFASGTYTVEVYEDYGGFIGSTTVTID